MRELDEAQDVGTTPERLRELAESGERELRRAVAGNANAPWEVLERLAREFPKEFLGNPVGELQLLVRPEEVFVGLEDCNDGEDFAQLVLKEEGVPEIWMRWFMQHPVFARVEGIEMHVTLVGEMRNREEAYEDLNMRFLLAQFERTSVELVRRLAGDKDQHIRYQVARRKEVTREVLTLLSMDPQVVVRGAVAENEKTPLEIVRKFVGDVDVQVRKRVAKNRKLSEEMIRQLAGDEEAWVRGNVAENESAPDDVVDMLARDPDFWVCRSARFALLRREELSEQVLKELAQDDECLVREGVAKHKKASKELLKRLAQDEEASVRGAVALNEGVSEDILCALAQDQSSQARELVVLHPRLPFAELERLEEDRDKGVRERAKIVRFIREHPQAEGVTVVPVDPYWSSDEKIVVYLDWVEGLEVAGEVKEALLRLLALDDASGDVLLQRLWVPEFLLRWYADKSWRNRWWVAVHAGTPEDVRERLKRDGNRAVRAAARGVWEG